MIDGLFSRTGVRYEVAIDVLGAIIAHYSELIAIERDKPSPNESVIADAQREKDLMRSMRDDLNPLADDAIERVIAEYGPKARALYSS